jgi:hypothetical protein
MTIVTPSVKQSNPFVVQDKSSYMMTRTTTTIITIPNFYRPDILRCDMQRMQTDVINRIEAPHHNLQTTCAVKIDKYIHLAEETMQF